MRRATRHSLFRCRYCALELIKKCCSGWASFEFVSCVHDASKIRCRTLSAGARWCFFTVHSVHNIPYRVAIESRLDSKLSQLCHLDLSHLASNPEGCMYDLRRRHQSRIPHRTRQSRVPSSGCKSLAVPVGLMLFPKPEGVGENVHGDGVIRCESRVSEL